MRKTILFIASLCLLASCGVYRKYERPELQTEGLFQDNISTDTASLASVPWRELFTDTCLQHLISTALAQNTDLRVAYLKVEEAKAVVQRAKLSYLPSLGINVEGSISKFDGATSKAYNAGAAASWELDIFGKLTAAKREAVAALESSQAYRQVVRQD